MLYIEITWNSSKPTKYLRKLKFSGNRRFWWNTHLLYIKQPQPTQNIAKHNVQYYPVTVSLNISHLFLKCGMFWLNKLSLIPLTLQNIDFCLIEKSNMQEKSNIFANFHFLKRENYWVDFFIFSNRYLKFDCFIVGRKSKNRQTQNERNFQ